MKKKARMSTIYVRDTMLEAYEVGDTLRITDCADRWWKRMLKRVWYFITFRKPPVEEEFLIITDVEINGSEVTITLEEESDGR